MPGHRYNDTPVNGDYPVGFSAERHSSYDFSPRGAVDAANGYTPRGVEGRLSRQNSEPVDGGAHVYSVDHLVTWSIGSEHGVLTHEDGMRQLSKMERQTGIFTMRCLLTVDPSSVQIVDGQSGNAMELFPLACIRDPVAVRDKNGMFNNIALFTVVDEPKSKHSPSDMHIFQVVGRSARELADDIADAIAKKHSKPNRSSKSQQPSASPTVAAAAGSHEQAESPLSREQMRANRRAVEVEGDNEEDIKLGLALLNRCFDDVERFVLRLKHSAKAFQELVNRKNHSKGRKHGDGMLTMRSKTPAPAEFVQCFQKVKLSFNLMARLKSYLHNPNATELVHFLFTPLSLLVEASNDPRFDIHDLVSKVVTPLLSKQAVEMLENCLTSKEYEFWTSLGDAWCTPKHKYTHKQSHEFRPTFSDGYQPPESWLELFLGDIAKLAAKQAIDRRLRDDEEQTPNYNDMSNGHNETSGADRRSAAVISPAARRPSDIPLLKGTSHVPDRNGSATDRERTNPWDDYQKAYLTDLQQRNAKIYEAIQDRKGNNAKELTIRKGEIVEVLEDTRNWWKCANINGDQGFIPYTLLNKYEHVASIPSPYSPRGSLGSTPAASVPVVVPPPPPPPPPPMLPPDNDVSGSNWTLTKKTTSSSKADKEKKAAENAATKKSDDFSIELREKLRKINIDSSNAGSRLHTAMSPQVFIDSYSSADDVANWLKQKGFQEPTRRVLSGYNGSELFHLSNDALTGEFGHNEGSRLISQIKLMKTTAGYTQSGSSQLRRILERRKQRAENGEVGSDDSDELASASAIRSNSGRKY